MNNESKVYVERTFECDIRTLFDWLTKPELIAQWFGPKGLTARRVESNLKVGGDYLIELLKQDGTAFTIFGIYTEVREPYSIRFTHHYSGLEHPPPPSTVAFTLNEADTGQSRLSMVQEFEVRTPDFETRTQAWKVMFGRLSTLLDRQS